MFDVFLKMVERRRTSKITLEACEPSGVDNPFTNADTSSPFTSSTSSGVLLYQIVSYGALDIVGLVSHGLKASVETHMASNPDIDNAIRETRRSLAKSTSHFDANAILRGAQLTVVGGIF